MSIDKTVLTSPDWAGRSFTGRAPTVLQIARQLGPGGIGRSTIEIARAVAAAGGTALVASAGGPLLRELRRAGAEHIELPLNAWGPFGLRANAKRLEALIAEAGVDLVHVRGRGPAWSGVAAARRAGIPVVATMHRRYRWSNPFNRAYTRALARADAVIALSESQAAEIRRVFALPAERVPVIPRGIDLEIFHPDAVTAERVIQLARLWRLPDDVPVVLMPGPFVAGLGHEVLLKALVRLRTHGVRCLIIGQETHPSRRFRYRLERQAASLGIAGIVHVIDHCADMAAAYKLADVVVAPATEPQAFPLPLVEAQALGRPVIASGIGAAPEVLEEGVTGWLVPPGDADALAAALEQALGLDEPARLALADRALTRVALRHDQRDMAERTLALYDGLLAGAAGRAGPANQDAPPGLDRAEAIS